MDKFRQLLKNRINAVETVYAVAFAVMTVASRHTVYSDDVASSILTVYVTKLQAIDILVFLCVMVPAYMVLEVIKYGIGKLSLRIYEDGAKEVESEEKSKSKKIGLWAVVFAVIMICYIPYMMSCWPGGIYNDTSDSIDIALYKSPMSNQNTVLYALLWRFVFWVGRIADQGDYGGLKLMTVLQCAAIAATAASFITWIRGKRVKKWVAVMLTAIVALVPIFPYYGISLWKETWFGLELFLYTWMWYVFASKLRPDDKDAGGGDVMDARMTALYVMSTALVIFGRNNGLYTVLFVMIISAIVLYRSMAKGAWKKLAAVNITIAVLSLLIQGPVYKAAGVSKGSPAESLGIPLQQTAYMISNGAVTDNLLELSDSQYEVITSIMPLDAWVTLYNPVVVDSIKFGEYFDKDYFNAHTGDFLKAYAGLIIRNPKAAIQGYLLSTIGFWDAYKASSSAYICTQHTPQAEYFMSDYFTSKTGRSLSDIAGPRRYISSGALVWIMLGLFVICVSLKRSESKTVRPDGKKTGGAGVSVLAFLPGIGLWLTYMLATPLSFSFRYLFGLLLCIPLYLGSVIEIEKKNSVKRRNSA